MSTSYLDSLWRSDPQFQVTGVPPPHPGLSWDGETLMSIDKLDGESDWVTDKEYPDPHPSHGRNFSTVSRNKHMRISIPCTILCHLRIFVMTFFSCLHALLWSGEHFKSQDKINFTMLLSALLIFFFATIEVLLAVQQSIEAFILLDGDVVEKFDQTSKWVIYMWMVDYIAQTWILVRSREFHAPDHKSLTSSGQIYCC
jgi:hypothetical protein